VALRIYNNFLVEVMGMCQNEKPSKNAENTESRACPETTAKRDFVEVKQTETKADLNKYDDRGESHAPSPHNTVEVKDDPFEDMKLSEKSQKAKPEEEEQSHKGEEGLPSSIHDTPSVVPPNRWRGPEPTGNQRGPKMDIKYTPLELGSTWGNFDLAESSGLKTGLQQGLILSGTTVTHQQSA
jgi:hypothetical protein